MLQTVTTVFQQIITWFGSFITALFGTGETAVLTELAPLMFIGLGISIMFVLVKAIRKIMWGN